jgi:hypothetical protein
LVLLHGLLTLEKLQNVMDVTPAPTVFWQTEQITKRRLTRTNNKEGTDHEEDSFSFRTGLRIHHRNGGRNGRFTYGSSDG